MIFLFCFLKKRNTAEAKNASAVQTLLLIFYNRKLIFVSAHSDTAHFHIIRHRNTAAAKSHIIFESLRYNAKVKQKSSHIIGASVSFSRSKGTDRVNLSRANKRNSFRAAFGKRYFRVCNSAVIRKMCFIFYIYYLRRRLSRPRR